MISLHCKNGVMLKNNTCHAKSCIFIYLYFATNFDHVESRCIDLYDFLIKTCIGEPKKHAHDCQGLSIFCIIWFRHFIRQRSSLSLSYTQLINVTEQHPFRLMYIVFQRRKVQKCRFRGFCMIRTSGTMIPHERDACNTCTRFKYIE